MLVFNVNIGVVTSGLATDDVNDLAWRFVEQPCEIVYIIGGETRRHYPDIYIEYQHEKQLWEVKDDSCASEADLLARTKLLTEGLKAHGFTYRLVLASELEKQPRLQNASILLSHGRGP